MKRLAYLTSTELEGLSKNFSTDTFIMKKYPLSVQTLMQYTGSYTLNNEIKSYCLIFLESSLIKNQ